ncbi:hypothetical protein ACLOJK_037711 [Asimina triloba]
MSGHTYYHNPVGLYVALTFALPIMMHPVNEIVEAKVKASTWFRKLCECNAWCREGQRPRSSTSSRAAFLLHLFRVASMLALAVIASFIPGFGALVSLVGSTFCALLSFVLSAIFHLALAAPSFPQRILDRCIFLFGVAFACYGTYTAVSATP